MYIDVLVIIGYGGYFRGLWFFLFWLDEFIFLLKILMKEEDCVFIVFYELYFIVVVLILWGEMWKK